MPKGAVAKPPTPRLDAHGRALWAQIPGFVAWIGKEGPNYTNHELADEIERRYGRRLTQPSIDSLRRVYRARQSDETRRRAFDARANTFSPAPRSEEQSIISTLRRTNANLLKQLEAAKMKNSDLVAAVYQAARDAAESITLDPIKPPKEDRRSRTPETAIAVLSDWQLAKVTKTYDSDVCAKRIGEYGEKVITLAEVQRSDHPVKHLKVYLLGDIVEGELIFPGQAHLIDASLYRQVMVDGPRALGSFLARMLTIFERVDVVGVIGNHGALGGRARRDYHPESNADAMMYEATRMVLKGIDGDREPRLAWADNMKPRERNWYAVDYVGKYGFLLFHGDQIKGGFAGFPWYSFAKKIMGWRMGAIPEPFHYALSGHFHTPVRGLYGNIRHWGNGSTESANTYAAEMLAAQGTPSQWLLFAHPEHGVTAEYEVHLT